MSSTIAIVAFVAHTIAKVDANITYAIKIYEMALEFKARYPSFHLLKVEEFASDLERARQTLEFVGVTITKSRYERSQTRLNEEKDRTTKVDSLRNSDLFHDPRFEISETPDFRFGCGTFAHPIRRHALICAGSA